MFGFFFFKQKTAYDMRISDWSSDVCSSDLDGGWSHDPHDAADAVILGRPALVPAWRARCRRARPPVPRHRPRQRIDAVPRGRPRRAVAARRVDRKSVVKGKSVAVRVDSGGRGIIKKKQSKKKDNSRR